MMNFFQNMWLRAPPLSLITTSLLGIVYLGANTQSIKLPQMRTLSDRLISLVKESIGKELTMNFQM